MLVKPFIAVLVLYSSSEVVLGERLMYNGRGRARASLWHGHAPGSAVPSVPDSSETNW